MQVVQDLPSRIMTFPVSGAGANIAIGALMMPGVTGDTNIGVAIPVTSSSNAQALGVLVEKHYNNTANLGIDATYATPINWWAPYTSQPAVNKVQLIDNCTLIKVEFDLTATGVTVASATNTVVTITSLDAGYEDGFLYVRAGTGIGQLIFIKDGASGTATSSAVTTTLDSTSRCHIILPYFYDTPVWKVSSATAETKLDSTAAVGTGRAIVLSRNMVRNGLDENLDNLAHHNLQSLNSLNQLAFYHLMSVVNSGWHRIV